MGKPARRGLKFSSFDELLADVERLRSGPYEQAGKWDLGMIMDHLTKTMNAPFGPPAMKNPPWPIGAVMRFFYCRFARRGIYPKFKIPVPPFLAPTTGGPMDGEFDELVKAVEKVKEVRGESIEFPPFGKLPIEDFRGMQLLHAAHHLSFLKLKA